MKQYALGYFCFGFDVYRLNDQITFDQKKNSENQQTLVPFVVCLHASLPASSPVCHSVRPEVTICG